MNCRRRAVATQSSFIVMRSATEPRELQRQTSGRYIFETERRAPFTTDAVNRLIKRIGEGAGFPFKVYVQCYALANAGPKVFESFLAEFGVARSVLGPIPNCPRVIADLLLARLYDAHLTMARPVVSAEPETPDAR
jgi:hypothetical protein